MPIVPGDGAIYMQGPDGEWVKLGEVAGPIQFKVPTTPAPILATLAAWKNAMTALAAGAVPPEPTLADRIAAMWPDAPRLPEFRDMPPDA